MSIETTGEPACHGRADPAPFRLYGTSACHLCEVARALVVTALRNGAGCEVEEIDISDSDDLMARYGERIPVLRHPDGRELNWPFSALEVESFLAA